MNHAPTLRTASAAICTSLFATTASLASPSNPVSGPQVELPAALHAGEPPTMVLLAAGLILYAGLLAWTRPRAIRAIIGCAREHLASRVRTAKQTAAHSLDELSLAPPPPTPGEAV